ncbi:TraG family conjugative transposon ATPase [Galbibacter mesophilus]|uniref:TraG family conjugative transposon ATPase n=1 Tax=Galbibacter mesophilus TaxID=379069 RepID=UPI00191CA20F|nr:TraG family conjugative transposon ATPase [Galbibacter mesophilus]MCM5663633.1 TraG family conjugative transposon ATPase [Galbibacter mesophilus]
MKTINFSAYHPILTIEDNMVFVSNGNVMLCYKVRLPEIYSLSESDFEKLHGSWFQAFKSLPKGTVIHKQDVYRKCRYTGENLPNETFLQKATYNYFKDREYMEHHSYLFFVLPLNKTLKAGKYINPFKKVEDGIHKKLDHRTSGFMQAVRDAVSFINNGPKIGLEPIHSDVILKLTHSYFNGFNEGLDTDIGLEKKGISIGDHHFDVMAVNSELCFGEDVQTSRINDRFTSDGSSFHQGSIDGLGPYLDENHIVNHILYLDDKHKWRKLLDKKIEELSKSSNFGTQNRVVLKKIRHIVDRINGDDSSRIIRGHLNVVYWSESAEGLDGMASKLKAEFKELDILPYCPKGEGRKHYFLNSHPCFSSNFSNEDLYVSDLKHALCLWINSTNYTSDTEGVIFNDRQDNIPVLKDVWDAKKKRIKASNFAIFAPTGEGKSFLANNILRQYFEEGVRLVIIDLGGSYAKFAKLYPDDHIILRYEQGKNLGINPFYISGESDLTPERLEDLSVFLLELLAEGKTATKGREVAMKKVLLHYYGKVRKNHSLASLYQFVDRNRENLIQDLGIQEMHFSTYGFLHILSEYVEGGLYSFLFSSDADQTYRIEDKRMVVFELDEVRDNREILSVMLKLIKSAVQRTIWRNRSERGIILFDEFAKQLKFDNVLESVEFYYQAIRKQNGAIGIILQSINQLPNNSTAASILENTQVIYSLRNEKGYGELRKRLNLSSHDLDQLRSMRNNLTGERKYTEIFIKIGKESNIFRLEVPPEVYAAYLTDGTENDRIMRIYEKTNDMEKAIKEYTTAKTKEQ